jgi:hypothetical protein
MGLQVALSLGVGILEVVSYCTIYNEQSRPLRLHLKQYLKARFWNIISKLLLYCAFGKRKKRQSRYEIEDRNCAAERVLNPMKTISEIR